MANLSETFWLEDIPVGDGENIEVHRCRICHGVFGIDSTFTDQVSEDVACPMCNTHVKLADTMVS